MNSASTILITGGTGMIGTAISNDLISKGHKVIILTRTPDEHGVKPSANIRFAKWDVKAQTIDVGAIQSADYIIHLAGAGIADKRWTEKRKEEITRSRVDSSKLLVKALKENKHHVKAFVSASAIGWYGEDQKNKPPHAFIETDPSADNFLGETGKAWEESVEPINDLGIRLIKLRTGIVLSNHGGALKEFEKPIRFGIAAILGGGKQIVSWIHIDDLVRMYLFALQNENLNGVFNAVAPIPVSNKELTIQLAKQMKDKFYVPLHVPDFLLQWVLGDMSIEVLKSTRVSADKIKSNEFIFQFPTISAAIKNFLAG